jgi:hypothetical protein
VALTPTDREWFDGKFSEVHEKINTAKEELTEKISDVDTRLRVHQATPCEWVEKHVERHHNTTKTVGLIGGMIGITAAVWEGFKWLIGQIKH